MCSSLNLAALLCYIITFYTADEIFFQSKNLVDKTFVNLDLQCEIKSDNGSPVAITGLKDSTGLLHWYTRNHTPVCLTGECKLIDIGIYWSFDGNFFGLEVYGEHLSKTDHTNFTQADYAKLINILNDDWFILREYELDDLTAGADVDGFSGATRDELSGYAVEHAVYTTYTIWHLVHKGEKEQIIDLTVDQLKKNPELFSSLSNSNQSGTQYFLMDLLSSGKIKPSQKTDDLLLEGLYSTNQAYKSKAFRSLRFSDISDPDLQIKIAMIYANSSMIEKLKILKAFEGAKVSQEFYDVLNMDRQIEDPWFSGSLMKVLEPGQY